MKTMGALVVLVTLVGLAGCQTSDDEDKVYVNLQNFSDTPNLEIEVVVAGQMSVFEVPVEEDPEDHPFEVEAGVVFEFTGIADGTRGSAITCTVSDQMVDDEASGIIVANGTFLQCAQCWVESLNCSVP
jgi:lipoprotein NlpI